MHDAFKAMAQGLCDYTVDVFPIESQEYGTLMTIGAQEGAIYVTKAQEMAFWGLTDPQAAPDKT